MGVQVAETTAQYRRAMGAYHDRGGLLMEVEPGGPADKAGLKVGDVVVRVGGYAVGNAADMVEALEDRKAGQEVKVEYVRDRKTKFATVRLAEAHPPRARLGRRSFDPQELKRDLRDLGDRIERRLKDVEERLRRIEDRDRK